jgi:DnaJ family protein C protein 3
MQDDENVKLLLVSVLEGEVAAKKAVQAQKAQLWTVCMEAATEALRTASHSLEIRQEQVDCSLAGILRVVVVISRNDLSVFFVG